MTGQATLWPEYTPERAAPPALSVTDQGNAVGAASRAVSPAVLRSRIDADMQREARMAGYASFNRRLAEVSSLDPVASPLAGDDYAARLMAYADDMGFYSGPDEGAEISEQDRRFAWSATGKYLALCKERTGDTMPDADLLKRRRQSEELLSQTVELAEKMREVPGVGYDAYRDTPFDVYRLFLHSGELEKLPGFRRCCFLPYVAQRVRAPMVASLEYWLSRNPFARFWTFTSGVKVRLSGVRDRAQWLHSKLNDLNNAGFMRDAGVRMVFRSTELGTPETDDRGNVRDGGNIERDETGQLYFHVHAHVVVELTKGFIPPEKWSAIVAKVGAFWPAWWGEGGVIRSARECCKYVTKPGEMTKLAGWELVELQKQLSRLKLVQPLGSLKDEIRDREAPENPRRLVKRQTPEGRCYFVVEDWNKHVRRTRSEKAQDAAEKLSKKDGYGDFRVLSRGTPRFGRCGVAEPVVTLMIARGVDVPVAQVRAHPLVAPVIRATAHEFYAGSAIRVHTRTSTAGEIPAPPEWSPPRTNPGSVLTGRTPKY